MTNLTNAAGAEQPSETDLCFACRRLMTLNSMKLEVHFQQKQVSCKAGCKGWDGAGNAAHVLGRAGHRFSPEGSALAGPSHHPLAAPSPGPVQMPFELTRTLS